METPEQPGRWQFEVPPIDRDRFPRVIEVVSASYAEGLEDRVWFLEQLRDLATVSMRGAGDDLLAAVARAERAERERDAARRAIAVGQDEIAMYRRIAERALAAAGKEATGE